MDGNQGTVASTFHDKPMSCRLSFGAAVQLHSFPGTILALLVQMGALIW